MTEEELHLIQSTFKDNDKLLKLLRKVFLPEYDADAPLGQVIDLWMTVDLANLSPRDAEIRIWARNMLITHIEGQLMQLNLLSNMKDESPEDRAKRIKADSSR